MGRSSSHAHSGSVNPAISDRTKAGSTHSCRTSRVDRAHERWRSLSRRDALSRRVQTLPHAVEAPAGLAWRRGAAPRVLLDSPGGACTRSGRALARMTRRGSTDRRVGWGREDGEPGRGAGVPPTHHRPRRSPDGSGGDGCTRAGSLRHGRPASQERHQCRAANAAGRDGAHDHRVCVTNDTPRPSRCAMRYHTGCCVTCGSCIARARERGNRSRVPGRSNDRSSASGTCQNDRGSPRQECILIRRNVYCPLLQPTRNEVSTGACMHHAVEVSCIRRACSRDVPDSAKAMPEVDHLATCSSTGISQGIVTAV